MARDLLRAPDVELHLLPPDGMDLIIMGVAVVTEIPNKEQKIPEVLQSVPTKLRSKTSTDVGLLVSAQTCEHKNKGRKPTSGYETVSYFPRG